MTEPLLEKALFVGEIDENMDLSQPPKDGEEYVKRVILEARKIPEVVVAKIDRPLRPPSTHFVALPDCEEAPESVRPSTKWQEYQVFKFSNLRNYLETIRLEIMNGTRSYVSPKIKLPSYENYNGWIEFCTGANVTEDKRVRPTLQVIFAIKPGKIERILEHLIDYVEEHEKLERKIGEWLYSLMALIDQPLSSDILSNFRRLARTCSLIRKNPNGLEKHEIGALNLFICLVSRYFRQLDLMDKSDD